MHAPDNILISGSSSRVGASLVSRLLTETDSRLWLILRKHPDKRDIWMRVREVLNLSKDQLSLEDYRDRIVPIWGDMRKRHLGIQDRDFQRLCEAQPSTSIHLAALSKRKDFSKNELLKTNFDGTNRFINLSAKIGVKRFLHLGWLYAFSKKPEQNAQADYLNFLEEADNFYNINEFIHQISVQSLVKRCRDLRIQWQVVCPAYFVDVEYPSDIHKRWYFNVVKLIEDLYEEYRRLGKKHPVRLIFPTSNTPISLCRPEFAAQVLHCAVENPKDFDQKIVPVIEDELSVKQLLKALTEAHQNIRLEFTENTSRLPLLEKILMRQSVVFFEYLFHPKSFPGIKYFEDLCQKYGLCPKKISDAELRKLAEESLQLSRQLSNQHKLSTLRRWGHRLFTGRSA